MLTTELYHTSYIVRSAIAAIAELLVTNYGMTDAVLIFCFIFTATDMMM